MLRKGDNPIDLICEQKLYDEGINYRISFHHLNFLNLVSQWRLSRFHLPHRIFTAFTFMSNR